MNKEDHDRLREKVDKLIWADAEDLLPGDEHLLTEDFDTLGRASAMDQILWVAETEASIAAVSKEKKRDKTSTQPMT